MMHNYPVGRLPRQLVRHLITVRPGHTLAALLFGLGTATTPTLAQGTFAAPAYYNSSGVSPIGITAGDLNGDGRADIVLNNFNSSTAGVGVLLNAVAPAAAGTFPASATTYNSGGSNSAGSAIGDVNGDGRPDIVAGNINDNTVGVLLNPGNGTFPSAAITYSTGGAGPVNVSLGDVNGDGRLDIVAAHQNGGTVGVLLNSATTPGTFGAAVQYTAGNQVYGVRLGDVNGDGRLDIVTSNFQSANVSVLLNSATTPGTFGAATSYLSGGSGPLGMVLGDVNGDGRLDIVVNHQASSLFGVLLNSATTPGTFGAVTTYNNGGFGEGVAVGDVSGDGRLDIVVSRNSTGTAGVFVNSGTGTFPTQTNYATGGGLNARVVLVDVNNDGLLDIAVSDFTNARIAVLRNTSTIAAPALSSINPTNGPVGTSVTLTGTNLLNASAVNFTGAAATNFTVVNATTITALVPAGATTGNVTVTTPGGTSNGVAFAVNPTVVISSTAGASGSTTGTSPIPFTITFSQSVTGFVAGAVSVTNGAVTSGSFSGSGTTYSFTVTPTTPGTPTTVSVPANVAITAAGTSNVASAAPYSIQYNAPVTATTWTGAVSSNWYANGNWTNSMPGRRIDARIPAGVPNFPVVPNGTAYAKNLTLASGATLTQSGGTLELRGDFDNSGTFVATGGTVSLRDSLNRQLIGGTSRTTLWNLTVGASGASLNGELEIQRVLTLNGDLSTASLGLTLLSNAGGTAMVVNSGGAIGGPATVQRYIDPSLNAGLGYRH
ncbi:beta strand repeat-containing protein, partial [Hymenobacter persicinus]